jgi:molybdopterin-guanine dinucleotide biosynthesis protein A
MTCALVLAGGRSRRFGSEKAMAMAQGRSLLAHAVDRLAAQGFEIAVNAPAGSGAAAWAADHGYPLISDDPADPSGPLAGVKAGLRWARAQGAERLATAPCDTPDLLADLEKRLEGALSPKAGAATARSPSGLQSLCTVWRVASALPVLEAHFARDHHPAVHDLLAELAGVEVVFDSDAPFANFNRPADLDERKT